MRLQIRPARPRDAVELAATMRAEDRAEIEAYSGREPLEVLVDGFASSSEVHTARYDGAVMAMWGVVPGPPKLLTARVGTGWLLSSELVDQHPVAFWRACKVVIEELLERWDLLLNVIDCRHQKALRWARRLGFQLEAPSPCGVQGRLFQRFAISREYLHV